MGEGVEAVAGAADAAADGRMTSPCVGMCASRRTGMRIMDGAEPSGRMVTVVLWTLKERQSSLANNVSHQSTIYSVIEGWATYS